jgi:MFS family permease
MLAAGAFISVQVNFYILISFILAYGSDANGGGMTRDTVLVAVLIASALQIVAQFWASAYSDRHGRRGVFMLGAALTGVAAFALFPLVSTGNFWLSVLGISMGLCFLGMMYGPQAAFFTELFFDGGSVLRCVAWLSIRRYNWRRICAYYRHYIVG